MKSGQAARWRHWLMLGTLPFCSLALAGPVAAHENYALVVSASDYPNLDQRNWLKGPKNDAVLVRDYLLHAAPVPFRPENITTLGSGEGMELATHQRILDGPLSHDCQLEHPEQQFALRTPARPNLAQDQDQRQ